MKLNFINNKRLAAKIRMVLPTAILLIISFLANQSYGQTATINIDYTGASGTCGSDNTYASANGSVNFNGGIPAGAIITSIAVSANVGEFLNGTTTFSFALNSTAIGNITGVTNTCQAGNFNASPIPTYNNTGTNTLSFSGSGNGIRGVYNATLTVTYTCPTATISYSSPTFCQSATSATPTISGATGGTFSSSAGLTINGTTGEINPSTSTAGNYTVHYQIGTCVDATTSVTIGAVPVSSVTGQTNITCYAANDGTITVSASGGISPYMFSVDNGANYFPATSGDTRTFTGLSPNTPYRIKVKDSNSCESK